MIKHIEASFIRIMEREGVEEVNTRQIQADYNEHSRYGISTQSLTNLLRRRPQFLLGRTRAYSWVPIDRLLTGNWLMRKGTDTPNYASITEKRMRTVVLCNNCHLLKDGKYRVRTVPVSKLCLLHRWKATARYVLVRSGISIQIWE